MPLTATHTEEEKMLAHFGKIVLHLFPCIFKFILSEVNRLTPFVRRSIKHNCDLKGKLSHEENTVLDNLQTTDGYSGFTLQLCYKFFIYFEWFDPPKQKWGNEPSEFDIELADDIERIRHVSNMIHSTTVHSVSTDLHNLLLEKVRRVCERIENSFEVPGRFSSEMDLEENISSEEILDLVDSIKEHKEILDNPFPSDRITQGRNRYARFSLIVVEMMPKLAREIINHNIQPTTLLSQVHTARRNDPAKLDRIISHDERVSLSTLRSGTYDDLDFTTIYKLIRSFAVVDEPAQGWGKQPMMHDTDIADDIERFRIRRNRIIHNLSTNISQTTFDEYFTDFTAVAKRVDQYLGKSTGTGFETEVHNNKTCPIDYELEQKYKQALQEIENMKYRFTEGRIHFYYGNTFERFIERVKTESAKYEKRQIIIVIKDNKDMKETARLLNGLKPEINTGQIRIEFDRAETGSILLFIDVLDKVISSDSFYSEVGNFIERILEFVYSAEKSKREMNVIMIQVEDCCDVDFVVDDEHLYTCTTEMPIDPKSIRVEVNVNTELFQSDDLFHAELVNFIKKASDTNGTGGKSDVSAILTTHVSEIIDDRAERGLQGIPDSSKVKHETTENTPNVLAETVKSDVKRLTKFHVHSETECTTDEDNVSCKHCHKQFPCDQCSVRRTMCKQNGCLVENNRRNTQIITGMAEVPQNIVVGPDGTTEKEQAKQYEDYLQSKMPVTKILVLITGGTLNMTNQDSKGLKPAETADLEKWLQDCGILQKTGKEHSFALSGKRHIECIIVECKSGSKDSSNFKTEDWNKIAKQIEENCKDYDGFVVIHGTDTMEYTASALSFMMANLQKTIVITGSQIPIYDIGSDAENNFKSAVYFAAYAAGKIAEVVICFNNKIFRGNRTAQIDCVKYDAYESPNYPVLAIVDNEGRIEVRSEVCKQPNGHQLELKNLSNEVCLLKLYPGITPTIVTRLMECHDGIVLETYGAGNAPGGVFEAFKNNKDTFVVNVTQCLRGGVTMSNETGKALQDAGVIPCGDMTTSAAFTKLCYLLENNRIEDIAEDMKRNLRGEITYMTRNRD